MCVRVWECVCVCKCAEEKTCMYVYMICVRLISFDSDSCMCCRLLQCVAVCCGVVISFDLGSCVLQCVAVYCIALQCVAVCCSALQCFYLL